MVSRINPRSVAVLARLLLRGLTDQQAAIHMFHRYGKEWKVHDPWKMYAVLFTGKKPFKQWAELKDRKDIRKRYANWVHEFRKEYTRTHHPHVMTPAERKEISQRLKNQWRNNKWRENQVRKIKQGVRGRRSK